MNTHYGVRTENKRTHEKGQYAFKRNTVYGWLNTRTWKASLKVSKGTRQGELSSPFLFN